MKTTTNAEGYQPISDVYEGKCIFVTGSSGFLGKVFLEKILYRCPKIKKVYVLLRGTEKESAKEKLKKMLDCPLFRRLKEERPQDLEKIVTIKGDVTKPKLGINTEDENMLIQNVSMVFHFAATVKFNDPLHKIFNNNVEGTRRMLELCLKLKKIEVFLYVSTAFSNGNLEIIDEVVYPPAIPLSDVDGFLNEDRTYTKDQIRGFLKGLPNTYAMSKGIAENLVAEFHRNHKLPVVIIRPSIVISCQSEPIKGWIGNFYGPTPIVLGVKSGIIRTIHCDGKNVIDLIPVDYSSNLAIVAAARCRSADEVNVFNSSSSAVNPITLQKFLKYVENDKCQNCFPKAVCVKLAWLLTILTFLLETVPAYISDFISRIIGKKNIHLKMLTKSRRIRKALDPFTSRTWMIRSHNTTALSNSLSPNDSHVFVCDATHIDWDEFIPSYLQGVYKYLLDKGNK